MVITLDVANNEKKGNLNGTKVVQLRDRGHLQWQGGGHLPRPTM